MDAIVPSSPPAAGPAAGPGPRGLRVQLEPRLFPLQAFINAIPDRAALQTLEALRDGVGAGFDEAGCRVPGEEEPGEDPLRGIELWVMDEEIVLPPLELVPALEALRDVHVARYPAQAEQVTVLTAQVVARLAEWDAQLSP